MTNAKVNVTKEVAEAIESYENFAGDEWQDALIYDVARARLGHTSGLTAISISEAYTLLQLAEILTNGYTVEKSPEDKVREYYDRCRANRDQAYSNGLTFRAERYGGQAIGVSITLDILGISISEVNA